VLVHHLETVAGSLPSCSPFVGPLLLHKHDFDSVYIFAHDVFLFNDAKLTNFTEKSVMLCHKIETTFQEIAFRAMKYYLE